MRAINKKGWGTGPWHAEPDELQWVDAATGLSCHIARSGLGTLCGYVGVPIGHPAYGQHYDALDPDVHGGLTFAGRIPKVDAVLWWLGFDCAHCYDLMPNAPVVGSEYRDVAYVTKECKRLASWLAALTIRDYDEARAFEERWPIRICFPLFCWQRCVWCGKEWRREKGWKVRTPHPAPEIVAADLPTASCGSWRNGSAYEALCCGCASTREVAAKWRRWVFFEGSYRDVDESLRKVRGVAPYSP